jgi:hypothetical protein
MHPIRRAVVVCLLSLVVLAAGLEARQAAAPQKPAVQAQTYEYQVIAVWRGIHEKILAMAKDWPESKYDWKPHKDSRSMLEEFRHVTIGLEYSSAQMKGEKFDIQARIKQDEKKPKTRGSVLSDMQSALVTSYDLVDNGPKPLLIFWIDHQAEHYGKLVSNYRMNGVVPPVSR